MDFGSAVLPALADEEEEEEDAGALEQPVSWSWLPSRPHSPPAARRERSPTPETAVEALWSEPLVAGPVWSSPLPTAAAAAGAAHPSGDGACGAGADDGEATQPEAAGARDDAAPAGPAAAPRSALKRRAPAGLFADDATAAEKRRRCVTFAPLPEPHRAGASSAAAGPSSGARLSDAEARAEKARLLMARIRATHAPPASAAATGVFSPVQPVRPPSPPRDASLWRVNGGHRFGLPQHREVRASLLAFLRPPAAPAFFS